MVNNKKVGEILFLSKLICKYIFEKRSNIEYTNNSLNKIE